MTLLNGRCLITLSLCSDIVLMQQVTADAFKVRVVITMIAVMSYKLMSVDVLQMLGVHVGRDPNQGRARQNFFLNSQTICMLLALS